MILVGIDVAKDKHDCHIFNSNGVILCDNFSFPNSTDDLEKLLSIPQSFEDKIKVGLETTRHYSSNLLSFVKAHDLEVSVFNPLYVNQLEQLLLCEKPRQTKTTRST
ncbi:MAG: IS110 family transposase [Christensenellaceae bacterium]|jgi:transposase|nr:IS110 family transposase [Christensenellaceae bacterium]